MLEDRIAKASRKDMYLREVDIQNLMAQGMSKDTLCEELANKWRVSPRTIETQYYHLVNAMEAMVTEGRRELRASLMARNDMIFREAVRTKKFKTALDANTAQARLGGLFEPGAQENKVPEVIEVAERDFSSKPKLVSGESEE